MYQIGKLRNTNTHRSPVDTWCCDITFAAVKAVLCKCARDTMWHSWPGSKGGVWERCLGWISFHDEISWSVNRMNFHIPISSHWINKKNCCRWISCKRSCSPGSRFDVLLQIPIPAGFHPGRFPETRTRRPSSSVLHCMVQEMLQTNITTWQFWWGFFVTLFVSNKGMTEKPCRLVCGRYIANCVCMLFWPYRWWLKSS